MMKKIKYLVLAFVFSVCFIGSVNAANYKEGEWKNPTCGNYKEKFDAAYTEYKFDDATGKFSTAGTTFATSDTNYVKTYEVKDDGATLVIYVSEYDNNLSGMSSIKALPAPDGGKCGEAMYTASKTAVAASDSSDENNNSGNSDDSSTSGEDDGTISGDEDETNNNNKNNNNNNNSSSTGDSTVKTTENPKTGITTVFLFLIPAAIAGGTILVLKKKNMFGF